MKKNIVVIEGDGIGPEVTSQAVKILDAVSSHFNHDFLYSYQLMGATAIDKTGMPLPTATLEECKKADAILFGAIGDPRYDNNPDSKIRPEQGLLQLRKELELFANIRPITAYPQLAALSPLKPGKLEGVDFVVFRELTGGIYFGNKMRSDDGTSASDDCVYHSSEIERIAHLAFQFALQPSRRQKLTLIDKANVLETSRLWRKVVQELSAQYPEVKVDYMFVDNAAMQVIMNPAQFDVVLTENMFGDIISDEASVLSGSLGLLPSSSIGSGTALFEPIHGSYPQAAGKDIANPIGSILSAAMMLDYFSLAEEAALVREAVDWTLTNRFVTKDIEPVNFYFTSTLGEMICDYISGKVPATLKTENIELRKSTII